MEKVPKWLSEDPDDYLHNEYSKLGAVISPSWQDEYGRWKHCYLPGLREEVSQVFPELNCTGFIKMVAPLIKGAVALVPNEIKSCIARNNPADWRKLPAQQIRNTWGADKVLFANAYLTLICFQMVYFIHDGAIEGVSISDDYKIEGIEDIDPDVLIQRFRDINAGYTETRIHRLSIHLSTFQLVVDRPEWWNAILSDETLRYSFERSTGQTDANFLKGLLEGCLISLATAQRISKWAQDQELFGNGELNWCYKPEMSPRKTAVDKEFIVYCDRETEFGATNA
ncbi:hypothetical protein [Planktotalea sp.]|uniref:hypothetical protein n=1 Tax=Planktotalea sp. TaxID=2029877 RepID=UPI00329A54C3